MSKGPTIMEVAAICGGSRSGPNCKEKPLRLLGESTTFSVIGSAYGEAFLAGPDRIEAIWFSSKLVGTIPGVGRVVFTTRPEVESRVAISTQKGRFRSLLLRMLWRGYSRMTSKRSRSVLLRGLGGRMTNSALRFLFFPAFASQAMYFDIQVLGANGEETQRLRSSVPMRFEAKIRSIPPLGTTFRTAEDVDFVDLADGAPTLRMLAGNPGLVEKAPGLKVELRSKTVDQSAGTFVGTIVVTATGPQAPARICWFVTPVLGATLSSPAQGVDTPFASPMEIPLSASFDGSAERPGLIVQCFSPEGPPMEDHLVILFRTL